MRDERVKSNATLDVIRKFMTNYLIKRNKVNLFDYNKIKR